MKGKRAESQKTGNVTAERHRASLETRAGTGFYPNIPWVLWASNKTEPGWFSQKTLRQCWLRFVVQKIGDWGLKIVQKGTRNLRSQLLWKLLKTICHCRCKVCMILQCRQIMCRLTEQKCYGLLWLNKSTPVETLRFAWSQTAGLEFAF